MRARAEHGRLPKSRRLRESLGVCPSKSPMPCRCADLWVELDPGDGPRDVLRGIDLEIGARRAGRADGPQRRRQEHPAARLRGARRAGAGAHARCRDGVRAPRPEPRRLPGPRAGRRRAARRGGAAALEASASDGPLDSDPRELSGGERQRLALAIVMAGRGGAERPGPRLPRRADPRHGPGAQGGARGAGSTSSRDDGAAVARRDPRRRVRGDVRRARRPARRR